MKPNVFTRLFLEPTTSLTQLLIWYILFHFLLKDASIPMTIFWVCVALGADKLAHEAWGAVCRRDAGNIATEEK